MHNSYPSSELVNDEEKYMAIRDALKPIRSKDFDELIARLSTSDTHPIGGPSGNARGASVRVEQIMTLRSVVPGLPEVVRALNGCDSYLLRMIGDMLNDERVKSTNDMVSQGLNDDALSAGGGGSFGTAFGSVTKKVYAVRANYNRLLDVARETYGENVTDIIEFQGELSKEHDLPISMHDDDPERSLSVATESSLILIDELGRGTLPIEGIGLAHATAEAIIKLKAFTFFTTHFHQLTYTLSKYPTVVNLHLAVEKSTHVNKPTFRLRFRHLLVDGASDAIDHYGLELARLADLPPDVLIEARKVSMELKAQDDAQRAASESNAVAARRKIILRIGVQLKQIPEHCTLGDEDLLKHLTRIQTETIVALRDLLPGAEHSPREDLESLGTSHGSSSRR
ncbi:MutS protein msh4 [Rhizoctonia solani]